MIYTVNLLQQHVLETSARDLCPKAKYPAYHFLCNDAKPITFALCTWICVVGASIRQRCIWPRLLERKLRHGSKRKPQHHKLCTLFHRHWKLHLPGQHFRLYNPSGGCGKPHGNPSLHCFVLQSPLGGGKQFEPEFEGCGGCRYCWRGYTAAVSYCAYGDVAAGCD